MKNNYAEGEDEVTVLSTTMLQRAEALRIARGVLERRGAGGSILTTPTIEPGKSFDLVSMASWIVTGAMGLPLTSDEVRSRGEYVEADQAVTVAATGSGFHRVLHDGDTAERIPDVPEDYPADARADFFWPISNGTTRAALILDRDGDWITAKVVGMHRASGEYEPGVWAEVGIPAAVPDAPEVRLPGQVYLGPGHRPKYAYPAGVRIPDAPEAAVESDEVKRAEQDYWSRNVPKIEWGPEVTIGGPIREHARSEFSGNWRQPDPITPAERERMTNSAELSRAITEWPAEIPPTILDVLPEISIDRGGIQFSPPEPADDEGLATPDGADDVARAEADYRSRNTYDQIDWDAAKRAGFTYTPLPDGAARLDAIEEDPFA